MNIANKLTILRVLFVPIFLLFMSINTKYSQIIAGVIFIVASLTDMLDGYLARKKNLITTFGKFMDPLADKILVSSAFIMLVHINLVPGWVVALILAREFTITGFRTLAASNGKTIAASSLGKLKTISQLSSIIFLLFSLNQTLKTIGNILLYISLVLTLVSGLDYLYKNKHVLNLDNI